LLGSENHNLLGEKHETQDDIFTHANADFAAVAGEFAFNGAGSTAAIQG